MAHEKYATFMCERGNLQLSNVCQKPCFMYVEWYGCV